MPERKSTRIVSPQKGGGAGGAGGAGVGRGGSKKELSLSKDQQRAVGLALEGKSIFFTGKRLVCVLLIAQCFVADCRVSCRVDHTVVFRGYQARGGIMYVYTFNNGFSALYR